MKVANKRYELTEEQWLQVQELIVHSKMGRPPKDDRIMLNAMLWMARSGAGWEDLPKRYGLWKTVYGRFCKWRDDGTFMRIFMVLREDADMENLSLDSTSVKVNSEVNQFIGTSRGGKTTKIHGYCNFYGMSNPLRPLLQ